jgi:membrane associated rhomboid family serine protease
MSDPTEPRQPLVEVGRYGRLAVARQRGLVVAASAVPHWIEREDDEWVLFVEEPAREAVLRELRAFEAEEEARPAPARFLPEEKIETLSLYVAGWLMSGFFLVQNLAGAAWMDRGEAFSEAIVRRHEWWRTVTALTLHGDVAHIAANLMTGLLFAAFVLPHFGTGMAWLCILLSGALGNAVNAWGYRGEAHASIGSSTAVFGALGLLVGAEFVARLSSAHTRSRWQLVLPSGAGLALLAFLGVGDEHKSNVDFMAHLWGFVVGLPLGALGGWLRVKERASRWFQRGCVLATLGLLAAAWLRAWR